MAKYQRETTQYPGVFWLTIQGIETLYIRYKRPGTAKAVEEKLGSKAQGWTAPRGNAGRAKRINGQAKSNAEQREFRIAERLAEESRQTLDRLWDAYLESKSSSLKGFVTDKNRYELHLKDSFGQKTPEELAPPDVDRLRLELLKDHSNGTVRNVLELLRRIINFGVSQQLCPPLNWTIKLPKPDPDSERIEVLTDEQFQKLHEIWASYHDRHIAHLHQFIGWSGSRPSEVLKLLWVDVDLTQRFYTKRDTKSGKSITFPISDKLHSILQQQRELLNNSPEAMRISSFVFPGPAGGQRKLHSYIRHFRRMRDLAGILEDYRPNYCLRDTVA